LIGSWPYRKRPIRGAGRKIAIVLALNKIDYQKDDVFLHGIRHFQEPGRPNEDDPAAPLRGNAALGLVRIGYPGVVLLLTDLLVDPAKTPARRPPKVSATLARPRLSPFLRFKARLGDANSEVTGACLSALMAADPEASLPFVAKFVRNHDEAVQADAALALGESRRPDALDILIDYWPSARDDALAEVLLLAIAMTRLPARPRFSPGNSHRWRPGCRVGDAFRSDDPPPQRRHQRSYRRRTCHKGDALLLERFKKKFA